MNLEKVLKVMAAVTALLVACSEVLNQANLYKNGKISEQNNTSSTKNSTSTEPDK